jgi:Spy/CpxP family protein refolding chaperone
VDPAQQSIKSFFSRYSAKLRKQEIDKPRDMHSAEQEEKIDEEDIEALESETAMHIACAYQCTTN